MKFSDIYKQVKKRIKTPNYTYRKTNIFLNRAMEELERWCFIPNCNKKMKNHKGVMIHIAKYHGITKKLFNL